MKRNGVKPSSSCGDQSSDAGGVQPIFSQERKSKLLLDDEVIDEEMLELGIAGAVTHHYGGVGNTSDVEMDEDVFHCLTKLKSRRSSPIQRLLQDVDICLMNFFDCINEVNQQRSASKEEPASSDAALKTESGGDAVMVVANLQCSA